MGLSFLRSIRAHLVLLVLISILPALGIIVCSGIKLRNNEMQKARENTDKILQGLAYHHEITAENIYQFLIVLSRLPDVQSRNEQACSILFGQLLKKNPMYANIFAATADGTVFASALSEAVVNIQDRKYYRDVLRTKDFSAGEYTVGVMSNLPVIPYAYPVLDAGGRVKAILVVGIKLASYGEIFSFADLPAGSTVNVLDHKYTLMYRHPESEKYSGRTDLPDIIRQISKKPDKGVFTSYGVDGTRRLFAYKGFYLRGDKEPYLYIRVGVPEEQTLIHVKSILVFNLVLLCAAFLIALLSAWFLGKIIIVKKLDRLLDVSRQIGDGDFTVRTDIKGEDELSRVAMAFDEMADKLEIDESRRKKTEEILRRNESELKALFKGMINAFVLFESVFDDKGDFVSCRFVFMNDSFERITGVKSDDVRGKTLHEIWPGTEVGWIRAYGEVAVTGVPKSFEMYHEPTGKPYYCNVYRPSENKSRFCVVFEDITERKRSEVMLRESEEKYRNIFENSIEGIFQTTPEGRFLVANPVLARMYGYEKSEDLINNVANMETQLYVHKEDRQRFKQIIEQQSFIRGFQTELYRKDGSHFWVSLNARVVRDETGMILYYEGTAENITDRKLKEVEIINQREQLRALSTRLAELEEIERENLARELHDQIGQNLTALGINLQIIQKNLDNNERSFIDERIRDSNHLIEQTTERIRYLMTELRPSILDDYGISAAIRWYGDQFAARTGMQVNIQGDEPDLKLKKNIENTLFRIMQEALTNVAKHSFADRVDIDFGMHDQLLSMTIKDNGIGFIKTEPPFVSERRKALTKSPVGRERRKWGINIMSERVIAVGGTCTVISEPGKGTEVRIDIPNKKGA